jgi:NADPH2:quinone reductase
LQLQERPIPVPTDREVLIKVMAAGVNRPDVAQRKGSYPPPPGTSQDIPGLEVAGIITKVGKHCVRYQIGDAVCALVSGGGYAEYCIAPEGQCLPVPENLSFEDAASLPETYFTVWSNVFDRGRLRPGESVLVHGGSSGIGVAAIQMIRKYGAKVLVTAGSDEKCEVCKQLGADVAINYKTQNFKDVIRTTIGKVDIVFDMIGGDYTADNLDVLAEDGRLVLINFMRGDEVKIKLSQVMRKRLTITGSTLRAREVSFKSEIASNLEHNVWPWLSSGQIKPVIFKIFPLEAAAAHALMESSDHVGKIMLVPGD